MKTKYSYINIFIIALPVFISLLAELGFASTSNLFLGFMGEIALGASAVIGMYYMAFLMIAFGFSIGVQILIARRNGEKRYEEIGPVFYHGVYFLLALAAVIILLSMCFSSHLLNIILPSPQFYDAASSYLNWRLFGFFFSSIGMMYRAFFMGTTKTLILILSSIVMLIANALFCYALIFGKLGFPELGIAGAAIGSSLAELLSVLVLIIYTHWGVKYQKYGLNRLPRFQPKILKSILHVSVWTILQSLVTFSLPIIFFLFMEQIDKNPLVMSNVVRNLLSIPLIIISTLALTCGALVSNLIGAGDKEYVPGTIRQHIYIGFVCLIVALPFLDLTLQDYVSIPELRAPSLPALWVFVSSCLLLLPAYIYFQAVSGTGNTRTALLLQLGASAAYVGCIAFVALYLQAHIAVCFAMEYVYVIPILVLSYLYIKKGNCPYKQI